MGIAVLSRPEPSLATKIYLFGFPDGPLKWEFSNSQHEQGYVKIFLPSMAKMQHVQHAWALKLTKIKWKTKFFSFFDQNNKMDWNKNHWLMNIGFLLFYNAYYNMEINLLSLMTSMTDDLQICFEKWYRYARFGELKTKIQ